MKTVSATIMFALVRVPVLLTGVTADREPKLKTLHKKCLTPINLRTWCPTCTTLIEKEDTVKGVKVGAKYQAVSQADLDDAKAERQPIVTLHKFVSETSVHWSLFNRHYHLIPQQGITDEYALLMSTIAKKKLLGLGSTALWGKEHPVAVRYGSEGLILSLLHQASDFQQVTFPPPPAVKDKQMVQMMDQIVTDRLGALTQEDHLSESRAKKSALIQATLEKQEVSLPADDLLTRLRLSVGGGKKVKA